MKRNCAPKNWGHVVQCVCVRVHVCVMLKFSHRAYSYMSIIIVYHVFSSLNVVECYKI